MVTFKEPWWGHNVAVRGRHPSAGLLKHSEPRHGWHCTISAALDVQGTFSDEQGQGSRETPSIPAPLPQGTAQSGTDAHQIGKRVAIGSQWWCLLFSEFSSTMIVDGSEHVGISGM